jgi:hypothetical protein
MEITLAICTIVLGIVGIWLTRFYARHSKLIADDQMMKDLFREFNERYDNLNEYLEEATKFSNVQQMTASDGAKAIILEGKIIDFFNLCAEEYYWYQHKKRIDPVIWESWNAGMNSWYESPVIKELWKKEVDRGLLKSYYITDGNGFFK